MWYRLSSNLPYTAPLSLLWVSDLVSNEEVSPLCHHSFSPPLVPCLSPPGGPGALPPIPGQALFLCLRPQPLPPPQGPQSLNDLSSLLHHQSPPLFWFITNTIFLKCCNWESPSGPVVRTPCSHCQGPRLDPWLGNKDPTSRTARPKKKKNSLISHILKKQRTSLVAQWLRIRLPMQGTRVQALVREDPTCLVATKPVHHNYWACALEPASHNYWSPRA